MYFIQVNLKNYYSLLMQKYKKKNITKAGQGREQGCPKPEVPRHGFGNLPTEESIHVLVLTKPPQCPPSS